MFLDDMTAAVGAEHVLVDDDVRGGYETDWTGRHSGTCVAVVRPGSTPEVADVMRACAAAGVDVITQAGNTGLVGGGVPRVGDRAQIVLSMRRFDQIDAVDTSALQVTAGAGVTLATWRDHARRSGLDTPVDFAARDSATIGGAIATNAGGSRVVRFGTMRQNVVGIEAVLADGEIVGSLAGLPKETVGLHWPSLLAGSEGTLGVITRARLRLVPRFEHSITALVACATLDDAISIVGGLRRNVPSLDAVELIQPGAMRLVSEHLGVGSPVSAPEAGTYVLVECADHDDPSTQLIDAFAIGDHVLDAAVATDPSRREQLVQFRDRITESIAAASTSIGTPTFKLDVAVPLAAFGRLLDTAERAAHDDHATLISFGHLAEGNVHLNFLGTTDTERIAAAVLSDVAGLGGTISAEHGVGIAKADWVHLIRSDGDLAAQRAVARALDPLGMLNPGVIHPLGSPRRRP